MTVGERAGDPCLAHCQSFFMRDRGERHNTTCPTEQGGSLHLLEEQCLCDSTGTTGLDVVVVGPRRIAANSTDTASERHAYNGTTVGYRRHVRSQVSKCCMTHWHCGELTRQSPHHPYLAGRVPPLLGQNLP
jgi:hypothetical protein